jgi:phosphinothricin acetyltransferase
VGSSVDETKGAIVVRPGEARDVPALLDIYNHHVLTSAATFDVAPHTLEQRQEWFSHHGTAGRYRLLVAERDHVVLGYATSSPFRARAAYDTSVETSIYVREGTLGQGIGGQLYGRLFALLAGEDIHRAYALVTPPNPASIALHLRFGFREIGRLHEVGRKFGQWWDVVWLEKRFEG